MDSNLQRSTPPSDTLSHEHLQSLAIIGFSLRLPQDAVSVDSFWSMLLEGRCAATEFPSDRLNTNAFYHRDRKRKDALPLRGGHFLRDDISLFDAPFFSISPAEAADMDPMQRGMLETTYRALENSGLPLETVSGTKTSVYVGSFTHDYELQNFKDPWNIPRYHATGTTPSMLATRVSHFYDLRGASLNVDTACSSSLVALDLACQSLLSGESSMSIVGGCNLIFNFETLAMMTNLNMLSPDGRCFSFDHRASGYSRGEGFGVLIVKRLEDAISNGDTIRAVIRSTSTNQDGRTPGITQPSMQAQEALIRHAYKKAGLDMRHTRLFEAHGTGTPVGDPIEAGAIGAAFKEYRSASEPLYVGALKSNVGHLEGASGVAAIIKSIISLEKGYIPPNTNFECLNPKIDAKSLHLAFPTECISWPGDGIRRVSINSFGFGGTNAHVILDDARSFMLLNGIKGIHHTIDQTLGKKLQNGIGPATLLKNGTHPKIPSIPKLLVWSAADEGGLKRLDDLITPYLEEILSKPDKSDAKIRDLAYTLSCRRTRFSWRSFQVVLPSTADEIPRPLPPCKPVRCINEPKLCFVFTGQGAQWAGMGAELFSVPVFRESLQNSEAYLHSLGASWNLIEEMLRPKHESRVDDAEFSQPLCTALQAGLVDYFRSLKLEPTAVVGHSSGEIAAAYCTGAISSTSALQIAYYRGKFAAQLSRSKIQPGAMIAVGLGSYQAEAYISRFRSVCPKCSLTVACINSPTSITVSGISEQVDQFKELLDSEGCFARKLKVNVAYHSSQMNEIANLYLESLQVLQPGPTCQENGSVMISTVTGKAISSDELIRGEYWVSNMVSPVRFSEALASLCARKNGLNLGAEYEDSNVKSVSDLFEIGPHSALQGPIRDILASVDQVSNISYTSAVKRNESGAEIVITALGHLYCRGHKYDIWKLNNAVETNAPTMLVDLPEYPFDHHKSYWVEPRESKEFRLRDQPRMDLLGIPKITTSYRDRRWRHRIKLSEMPWVEDHKMSGVTVYPAAGMLVMAIEAAKQCAAQNNAINGFSIKEVTFQNALRIWEDEPVEIEFCLRSNKGNGWAEFDLSSLDGDNWSQVCHGYIKTEYSTADEDIYAFNLHSLMQLLTDDESNLLNSVRTHDWYNACEQRGLGFGPSFQRLDLIRGGKTNTASAILRLFSWTTDDDKSPFQPHTIHPTSLDGAVQMFFISAAEGDPQRIETRVPARLDRLWVSNKGLNCEDAQAVKLFSEAKLSGHRKVSSVLGVDADTNEPRLALEGLDFASITNGSADPRDDVPYLCYNFRWLPDPNLLQPEQLLTFCNKANPHRDDPIRFHHDLRDISLAYIRRALEHIGDRPLHEFPPTIQNYIRWMGRQVELYKHIPELDDTSQAALVDKYKGIDNGESKFYIEYGENIIRLIDGDLDSLAILFGEVDLAKGFYREVIDNANYLEPFKQYMDLLAHKNPGMKILEVGAGTGSFTAHVLHALKSHAHGADYVRRYAEYDFTDISPSFFQEARETFATEGNRIKYRVLDFENPPEAQGFYPNTYDVIVAAGVLHVASDLNTAFHNVHRMLKPGGKLILIELTNPERLGCEFTFGATDGWWQGRSDPFRKWGPAMTIEQWNERATANGFAEADFVVNDFESLDCRERSLLVFSAKEVSEMDQMEQPLVKFIVSKSSTAQVKLAALLEDVFNSRGYCKCQIASLQEAAASNDGDLISLLDIDEIALSDINSARYEPIQTILSRKSSILWVSRPKQEEDTAALGTFDGLARTVRSENPTLTLVALRFPTTQKTNTDIIDAVLKAYEEMRTSSTITNSYEPEYMVANNILHIPRLVEERPTDYHIMNQMRSHYEALQEFTGARPLSLQTDTPGSIDSLSFIENNDHLLALADNEIEVQVKAAGISYLDALSALGHAAVTSPMGMECAGVVVRVGAASEFRPGDRVALVYVESFKTLARASDHCAVHIPNFMSFSEAAALPVSVTTAWHAMYNIARLTQEESVLVHSAAGGVGQTAIQLAQDLGAEVFATVGSQEKKQFLMKTYGIREDHVFFSSDLMFVQKIRAATHGLGVDVVLNSLAGEKQIASLDCVAPHGWFIELGKADVHAYEKLSLYLLRKNISFTVVDMPVFPLTNPKVLKSTLVAAMSKFKEGRLQPPQPLKIYGFAESPQAFHEVNNKNRIGKVVLEVKTGEQIAVRLDTRPSFEFSSNATYVISGGLGGLGRAIALWMVDRGARNLILLSRSGMQPQHHGFKDMILAKGAHLEAPPCDICDENVLRDTLEHYAQKMPPIKGCIQATAVLRDGLFDRMSLDDWNTATRPKIQGSWNLHAFLPNDLDFFIFISSLCGIVGKETTANYAAGNSYMDSLARYRVSIGQKAISLDLGLMEEAGLLAADATLMASAKSTGVFTPLVPQHLFGVLDYYCNPSVQLPTPDNSQLMVGIAPPAVLKQQNLEPASWMYRPPFAHMFNIPAANSSDTSGTDKEQTTTTVNFASAFAQAESLAAASTIVSDALMAKLASTLGLSREDLDEGNSMQSYGIDSLVAVELRNWFSQKVRADMAVFDIMGRTTFIQAGTLAASRSAYNQGKWDKS